MGGVAYQIEPSLSADEFVDVLRRSTLAERRPVTDAAAIASLLAHAGLIVTARVGGQLVGVARSLTDVSYRTYLSDVAVDAELQERGIAGCG